MFSFLKHSGWSLPNEPALTIHRSVALFFLPFSFFSAVIYSFSSIFLRFFFHLLMWKSFMCFVPFSLFSLSSIPPPTPFKFEKYCRLKYCILLLDTDRMKTFKRYMLVNIIVDYMLHVCFTAVHFSARAILRIVDSAAFARCIFFFVRMYICTNCGNCCTLRFQKRTDRRFGNIFREVRSPPDFRMRFSEVQLPKTLFWNQMMDDLLADFALKALKSPLVLPAVVFRLRNA